MRWSHIALLAGAGLVVGTTLAAFTAMVGGQDRQPTQSAPISVADIGGPFTLTDTAGNPFTEKNLSGRPAAIFFGFTFCPDICPTTLYELAGMMKALGPQADAIDFVFVSVDWERDGPQQVSRYLQAFDGRMIGLSGTQAEIEAAADAFKIHVQRVPLDDGGYTMDHTASVLLMGPDGRFTGTLDYDEPMETKLGKLRRLAGA
ncbi:SCO family protein [Aureimonas altamirensis]|uniref:SCO family protein n=1 Tax=Aureimonas altamirensis TaxID=370622 RepID=UPI001E3A0CDF|nr:SCO family protein [Aureimonas altamirensis]UHD45637.1 SCO family protein [Aureimonas altamirensis]